MPFRGRALRAVHGRPRCALCRMSSTPYGEAAPLQCLITGRCTVHRNMFIELRILVGQRRELAVNLDTPSWIDQHS